MKTLASRIRDTRKSLKLSQEALAEKAGVSQSLIHKLESGESSESRKLPGIAKALEVTSDWLATGEEDALEGQEIRKRQGTDEAPEPLNIAGLMPLASPATQDILQTLERGLKEGRLSQDDIKLLETIAKRLIASDTKPRSAPYGKLHDEAKKNNPTE